MSERDVRVDSAAHVGVGSATPVRVGVVGAGGITHAHVPALLALGAEVCAFSRHGVAPLVERYGIRSCATFDDLLGGCDVVDICAPTPTHLGFIEKALRAGKHVICEKPIARHASDGPSIAALARASGRLVLPAHVVRYFPQYADARDAVRAAQLGRVREARFSRVGAHPAASWFADDEQSGGVVLDLMIHDLDAARWILGEVTEVHGVVTCGSGESRAEARLTHRGGATSHVTAFWGPPGTVFRTSVRIDGDVDCYEAASDGDPSTSPYILQLREFLNAFGGGPDPRVTLTDGIRAVELAEAVLASSAGGTPVSV